MQALQYEFNGKDFSRIAYNEEITIDEDFLNSCVTEMTINQSLMITEKNGELLADVKDEQLLVSDKCEDLLGCLESVGITSMMYRAKKQRNMPFCRQHKFLEMLGPLSYCGESITVMTWPTVGFEIVTKKYVRNFGIYIPDYGIISSNKISHIIYGMAEYPAGDEMIIFSIKVGERIVTFQWGPRGIREMDIDLFVNSYYIVDNLNAYLISGYEHTQTANFFLMKRLEWYHSMKFVDSKDYILNIDGVNHLLLGTRKMVGRNDGSHVYFSKNCEKSTSSVLGSVMYDMDNHKVLYKTERALESYTTYEHIWKDALVVREFLKYTRMHPYVVKVKGTIFNIKIIAANAPIVENEEIERTLVFDRGHSKSGTSRNYYVMEQIRKTNTIDLNDVQRMPVAFIGNNRVYRPMRRHRVCVGSSHFLHKYEGQDINLHLVKENETLDVYETINGPVVSLSVIMESQSGQVDITGFKKLTFDKKLKRNEVIQGESISMTALVSEESGFMNPMFMDYDFILSIRDSNNLIKRWSEIFNVPSCGIFNNEQGYLYIPFGRVLKKIKINTGAAVFDDYITSLKVSLERIVYREISVKEGNNEIACIHGHYYAYLLLVNKAEELIEVQDSAT